MLHYFKGAAYSRCLQVWRRELYSRSVVICVDVCSTGNVWLSFSCHLRFHSLSSTALELAYSRPEIVADMAGIEKAPLLPLQEATKPQERPSYEEAETFGQEKIERDQTWTDQSTPASRQRHPSNQLFFVWPVWFRVLAAMFGVVSLGYFMAMLMPTCAHEAMISGPPVNLEAHIMSKCPDAKDCLEKLILPAMEQVSQDVNFTLSYIGDPTDSDDGVDCKHGPEECLGNMLELCAAKLYPDPKIYLGFTMCMSKYYQDIPQKHLVKDCALEHGISFENLNDCAADERGGLHLLKKSVERSKKVHAETSCTVRLDDKVWCIRDDDKWKDCKDGHKAKDLVSEIKKLKSSMV